MSAVRPKPAGRDVFVGRQPIYDGALKVYGYEILYRDGETNAARFSDYDQASQRTIADSFLEFGLDKLVGNRRGFFNLPRRTLLGEIPELLPRDRMVLEILENVEPDAEVVSAVRRLSAHGYTIALDDFRWRPALVPLVQVADIVKIDVRACDRDALDEEVEHLRGEGVKLLAEKIETREEFEYCKQLGFDLFQGYFLCRPEVLKSKRLPVGRLRTLRLLKALQDPRAGLHELERSILEDAKLAYKLLRCANSSFFALPRKIDSIREAIVMVGTESVRRWATLIALSTLDEGGGDLLVVSLVRAKMCELLAKAVSATKPESYFTVGLLSTLDAIANRPMDELLAELPLSPPVVAALARSEGPLGQALECVISYERGQFKDLAMPGLRGGDLMDAYTRAVAFADETVAQLVLFR